MSGAQITSNRILNVKDYGATGSGSGDDSGAIIAALAAANALGGAEVFFPAGTYQVQSGLAVPSNCSLVGEGKAASAIRRNGNFDMITMNGASSVSRVTRVRIADLYLDGSSGTGATIHTTFGDHFNFERLWFAGGNNAIIAIELFDSYFRAVEFNSCGTSTVRTGAVVLIQGSATGSSNEIYFSQCRWEAMPGNALYLDSNSFPANAPYGIWLSQCKLEGANVMTGPSFVDCTNDIADVHLDHIYLAAPSALASGSPIDGLVNVAGSWGWCLSNIHVFISNNSVASVIRWNPTGSGNSLENLVCDAATNPTNALLNFVGGGGNTGRITNVGFKDGLRAPLFAGTVPAGLWVDDFGIIPSTTRVANYTLGLGDCDETVEMNLAGANTLTIPPNVFPLQTQIYWMQVGAGTTTLTPGAGVTIQGSTTAARFAGMKIRQRLLNTWVSSAG